MFSAHCRHGGNSSGTFHCLRMSALWIFGGMHHPHRLSLHFIQPFYNDPIIHNLLHQGISSRMVTGEQFLKGKQSQHPLMERSKIVFFCWAAKTIIGCVIGVSQVRRQSNVADCWQLGSQSLRPQFFSFRPKQIMCWKQSTKSMNEWLSP